jgi:hypothetical protein
MPRRLSACGPFPPRLGLEVFVKILANKDHHLVPKTAPVHIVTIVTFAAAIPDGDDAGFPRVR